MKGNNSFFQFFSKVLPVLGLFFFGSAVQLPAQEATFQYVGQYHDYVIPQTNKQYIVLTAVGGDGGRIHFKNLLKEFKVSGGRGAFLKAYFKIGNESNSLKPGSTLRFIVGENGESRLTAGSTGAGGGGGTGIAYKEVGTQKWTLLMVTGGGGGAGHSWLNGKNTGEPGPAYSEGEEGDGTGGDSWSTAGGGGGAYGDDKFLTDGSNNNNVKYKYGGHAKAGWPGGPDTGEPTGGDCVDTGPQGGWGFGAGGDGDATACYPGGGGGYTGGTAGDSDGASAKGGSSYLNTSMETLFVLPLERGTTSSPENGYASLEFSDSPFSSIVFALNPNKCIDDYGSSTSNGNNIQTYTCTGNPNQQWSLNTEDRTIRSKLNADKCLDLTSGNTSNGANIQLWNCTSGNANQKWVYNGLFKTIHSGVNSDKCFDAKDASKAVNLNTNLQLWDCQYSNNNQKWYISGATTVSDASIMKHIVPVAASNFAVHSHTGAESGSNIQLWTKDNTNTAEQWYFDGLAIKMRNNQNLCIDLSQSNTSNGNNIQLYNCNGTNAQKWIYDGMTQTIRSVVNPDKCMQIEKNTDGVYGKRSNVDIQDCNGSDAQLFLIQE